jgi:hypothetical protein
MRIYVEVDVGVDVLVGISMRTDVEVDFGVGVLVGNSLRTFVVVSHAVLVTNDTGSGEVVTVLSKKLVEE